MKFAELIEYRIIEPFRKSLKPDEIANSLEEFNPKKHKLILGNCRFQDRKDITDLGVLEMIDGYANFEESKVENLGKLTTIGSSAYFENSNIVDLANLTTIGGSAIFRGSKVENLGNLTTIGGGADFRNSNVVDLGNLTTVEGNIYANGNKLTHKQVIDHLNKMNEVFFVKKRLHYLHLDSPLRIIGKVDSWDMSEINILLNDNWLGIVKNTMALERFFPKVSQVDKKILNLGKIKIDYKGKIKVL